MEDGQSDGGGDGDGGNGSRDGGGGSGGGGGRLRLAATWSVLAAAELFGGFTFSLISPFYTKEAGGKGISVSQAGLVRARGGKSCYKRQKQF